MGMEVSHRRPKKEGAHHVFGSNHKIYQFLCVVCFAGLFTVFEIGSNQSVFSGRSGVETVKTKHQAIKRKDDRTMNNDTKEGGELPSSNNVSNNLEGVERERDVVVTPTKTPKESSSASLTEIQNRSTTTKSDGKKHGATASGLQGSRKNATSVYFRNKKEPKPTDSPIVSPTKSSNNGGADDSVKEGGDIDTAISADHQDAKTTTKTEIVPSKKNKTANAFEHDMEYSNTITDLFAVNSSYFDTEDTCVKAKEDFRDASKLFAIVTGLWHSGTTMLSELVMSAPGVYGGFECGILCEKKPADFVKAKCMRDYASTALSFSTSRINTAFSSTRHHNTS